MSNRCARLLVLGCCCAVAIPLAADTIPTLTATSANVVSGEGLAPCYLAFGCAADGTIAGDFFTLGGTGYEALAQPFTPYGDNDPRFGFISPTGGNASGEPQGALPFYGRVMLGGTTTAVEYEGTTLISAPTIMFGGPIGSTTISVSAGGRTAPPMTPSSPTTTIVLPASITGGFTACPYPLFPPLYPICVVSPPVANIVVDLQGVLTVNMHAYYVYGEPNDVRVSESFTTTPDPPTILLVALGLLASILFRRKCIARKAAKRL